MADDDKDSKTEAPTAKKQTDAAEKGNVPFSRELSIFATILATYIYLVFFLPDSVGHMLIWLRSGESRPTYKVSCAGLLTKRAAARTIAMETAPTPPRIIRRVRPREPKFLKI